MLIRLTNLVTKKEFSVEGPDLPTIMRSVSERNGGDGSWARDGDSRVQFGRKIDEGQTSFGTTHHFRVM